MYTYFYHIFTHTYIYICTVYIYISLSVCVSICYKWYHSINLFPIPTRTQERGTEADGWLGTSSLDAPIESQGLHHVMLGPSWSILVRCMPSPRLIASRCWKPSEDGVFLIDSWSICWLSACQTKWIVLLHEISYLAVSEGSNFSTWAWSHDILENSMIARILRVSNTWQLGAGAGRHLPTGFGERVSAQTALWLSIWDAWYIGM